MMTRPLPYLLLYNNTATRKLGDGNEGNADFVYSDAGQIG
jgi:hypothetical protein